MQALDWGKGNQLEVLVGLQLWFVPSSGAGDHSSMVSDFSVLSKIHPAFWLLHLPDITLHG